MVFWMLKKNYMIKYSLIILCFLTVVSLGYYFLKKEYTSTIIILNGPSVSGKSSIQEAFIKQSNTPWIKIGIDNFFIGVLSNYYIFGEYKPVNKDNIIMQGIPGEDEDKNPIFTLQIGPAGEKIINGMNHAIKAYADCGNNIIVDYIAYQPEWLENLVNLLKGHKIIVVGINLPLDILEQREIMRKTSPKGHARSHYKTVHQHKVDYNLNIDSSIMTAETAAQNIMNLLK